MELKQQKLGLISSLSLGKWKVWIVMAIIATSLLLSSCDSKTADYKTDVGDTSLYKELYIKANQANEALTRKLDNTIKENTRLKERNAALKAKNPENVVLSERESALDEREKAISDREEQIKQDQARADNASSNMLDSSLEMGRKIGQLDKDEERIQELSEELKNSRNQLSFSTKVNIALLFLVIAFLVYIPLDKLRIFRAWNIGGSPLPTTIDVVNVLSSLLRDESSNVEALEQARDPDPKALPSENNE